MSEIAREEVSRGRICALFARAPIGQIAGKTTGSWYQTYEFVAFYQNRVRQRHVNVLSSLVAGLRLCCSPRGVVTWKIFGCRPSRFPSSLAFCFGVVALLVAALKGNQKDNHDVVCFLCFFGLRGICVYQTRIFFFVLLCTSPFRQM